MNIYPLSELVEEEYWGAGAALVSTVDGVVVALVYLNSVIPEWDGPPSIEVLDDKRLAPKVRELQALGRVHLGMLSGREFVEL